MNKNLYILLIGGVVLYYLFKKNINKQQLKKFRVQTPSGGSVNVRSEPNLTSNIISRFPDGAIFSAVIHDENWVKITYEGEFDAYINRTNLIEI